MWVIVNSNGLFVAPGGMASSFTAYLQRARTFATREAAERECCGNEHPVHVSEIILGQ